MSRMLPPEARMAVRLVQVDLSRGYHLARWAKERRQGFVLPTLTRCREWFESLSGISTPWMEPVALAQEDLPRELLELAGLDTNDGM
jgi:hypothetical protein